MRCLVVCALLLGVLATDADAKRKRRRNKRAPAAQPQLKPPPPLQAGNRKVVVLNLGALGIASDALGSLERYLRTSIQTIDSVDLISLVDVEIALRKNKAVAECGGGPRCAVEVGKLVSADVVVFGTIGALGESFNLNLRAVDVKTGLELARQKTAISGSRHQLIPEIRLAAYRLIAPDRIRGSLLIEIDIEGVEVEIDGQTVGVTPLTEEVKNLVPGDHVVVLRRPGYSQFQQEFKIKPFDTARLRLDLKSTQKTKKKTR